jgi:hypothetical protein
VYKDFNAKWVGQARLSDELEIGGDDDLANLS